MIGGVIGGVKVEEENYVSRFVESVVMVDRFVVFGDGGREEVLVGEGGVDIGR